MSIEKIIQNPRFTIFLTWSTYAIALFPIIPYNINSMLMIAWSFLSLIRFLSDKNKRFLHFSQSALKLYILMGGNYILLVLSLLYSRDVNEGLTELIAMLPMLFFPFIFFLMPSAIVVTKKDIQNILVIFWASTLILGFWLLFKYWQLDLLQQFNQINSFNNPFRIVSDELTDKHPTYLSLFFGFAACIAGFNLFSSRSILMKCLYSLSILVFIFHIVSLSARTPVIAMALALIIIVVLKLKTPAKRIAATFILLLVVGLLMRFTPSLYSRLLEVRETTFAVPVGTQHNSTNIRVGILKCSWELIQKNILLGSGIGSDKILLNECYSQFTTDVYERKFYNTHNQYLNFWLLSGIISILLFIASLAFSIWLSLKSNDRLMLFFLILMALTFGTENVLSRQAGVVYYYFFLCLLVYRNKNFVAATPVNH